MKSIGRKDLIYSWNILDYEGKDSRMLLNRRTRPIELVDETLRDGLQSPSVKMPSIEEKIKMLHFMNDLNIHCGNLGLPAAGKTVQDDVLRLAQEIAKNKLKIKATCAGRTVISDIEPMVEISQKAGIPIEAYIFIGSSMIRRYTENWSFDQMLKTTAKAVKYCRDNNLSVAYVTEDTTRAEPRMLKKLLTTAIENGAERLCVCDTVGYATADGVRNILDYVKKIIWDSGENVKIDWHGHNDRGLALTNSLVAAIDSGVDRIHGTCLGIGERAGNTSIDQILINLYLMKLYDGNLLSLGDYCKYVAKACDVPISYHYPAFGTDAFRTATGVHAAAIIKAYEKTEDKWLADYIYSSVPATVIGLKQEIEVGPMSGKSNVIFWLKSHGKEVSEDTVDKIFKYAKHSTHNLTEKEICSLI